MAKRTKSFQGHGGIQWIKLEPDPAGHVPTFHGPQFGVSRDKLEALAVKWETEAADDRWNGHYRQQLIACARELRELLKP